MSIVRVFLLICLSVAVEPKDPVVNPQLAEIIHFTKLSLQEYFSVGGSTCTLEDEAQLTVFFDLQGKNGDTILRSFLPYYNQFLDHASRCPQLVKAALLLLLNHELARFLMAAENVNLSHDAGMRLFDLYSTYAFYKYWTEEDGMKEARFVFWEDEVRSRFQRLWRNVYGRDSYCQCVEGYDFFSSMDTNAKTLLRRPDFLEQVLNPKSIVHKMIRRDRMCQSDAGGMGTFNVLAINSDCVAAMTTFNVLCASNFALEGRVNITLNLAEAAYHGLTLAGHCIDEEVWATERAEAVGEFFARVARHWNPNITGETLPNAKFLFRSEPTGQVWRVTTPVCEWLFEQATIRSGAIMVHNPDISEVSVCTETFTTPVSVRDVIGTAGGGKNKTSSGCDGRHFGLVVHNAVFGLNLWHDMHWIVKVFRQKRRMEKLVRSGEVIDVIVAASVSSQNVFGQLKPWYSAETRNFSIAEVDPWRKLHEPWLRSFVLTGDILSLNDAEGRCYDKLLWGAPSVRFDRELRTVIRRGEVRSGWQEMRNLVGNHSTQTGHTRGKILIFQRPVWKGRILVNAEELASRLNAEVVVPSANMSFIDQVALVRDSRVMIGPHGAALSLMTFMKRPGLVLELMAREVPDELLHCPDNVNGSPYGMYGGLARLVGVHHACIRSWSSANSKKVDLFDLTVWRKIDVRADVDRLAAIVDTFLREYP